MIPVEKYNFVVNKNTKQEMKKVLFIATMVCGIAIVSCGPSAEEKAAQEQARLDSIEAAEKAKAEEEAAAAAQAEAEAAAAAAQDSSATEEEGAEEEMHEEHSH